MRTLENRARANGKIQIALVAAIETILAGRNAILTTASRANNAIRPKPGFKIRPGRNLIWNQCEKFKGANRALAHTRPLHYENHSKKVSGSQVYNSQKLRDHAIGVAQFGDAHLRDQVDVGVFIKKRAIFQVD